MLQHRSTPLGLKIDPFQTVPPPAPQLGSYAYETFNCGKAGNKMIQGLIFDCDGTLADTMPLHWQAWQVVTKRYGVEFTEDRFYSLGGVPTRHILQMLAEEQGLSIDALSVAKEKEDTYLVMLPQVTPIESVVEVARSHRGKLPMAVASGGSRYAIDLVLRQIGIRDWFQTVVTNEDVVRQKPAPDIFLEAAKRIGVQPQFCRAFEDTDLGMQAIRDAGMEAVDIRTMLAR